ncbi:MAG: carboxypeptidase-like regulatory domain-containing protein [Gemmatimonadaceae bacterium]|nr:carboxypeptidase-like regulatory domain-containing protein [Gemmatimonadaceae bacterium]
MRARVFALLLAVCPLGAQSPTRLVTGIVTALETARPLDQARVTLLPAGRATFTASNGAFALTAVPLGRVRVRVARIGFVPVDTIFDVTEGTEPLRLLFRLNRLTVTLSTVTVLAFPPCAKPGPPTLARDGPDAMKLFEQVQEIAAQNRLLADSFPFLYHVERETVALRRSGDSIIEKIDSVAVQSNGEPLRYRPGRLVRRQADLTFALRLPSLADVAEPEFVR